MSWIGLALIVVYGHLRKGCFQLFKHEVMLNWGAYSLCGGAKWRLTSVELKVTCHCPEGSMIVIYFNGIRVINR